LFPLTMMQKDGQQGQKPYNNVDRKKRYDKPFHECKNRKGPAPFK